MGEGFGYLLGWASGAASIPERMTALGGWAIPEFWLPLLTWTAWAGAGVWLLGRSGPGGMRGSAHPAAGRRVAQVLLFMLPLALLTRGLVAPIVPDLGFSPDANRGWEASAAVGSGARAEASPQPQTASGHLQQAPPPGLETRGESSAGALEAGRIPEVTGAGILGVDVLRWLAGAGLGGVLILSGYGLLRFGAETRALRRLRAGLGRLTDQVVLRRFDAVARDMGIEARIDWRVGPPGSVPMTFGFRRPVVALPPEVLDCPGDSALAVCHELVHVKRHDYAWAWAEGFVASLFRFHPLVRRLARHIGQARERSCDLEVVSRMPDPRRYAELLVHMAGRPRAPLLVAAGLAPSSSNLKERLESMSRFADSNRRERTKVSTVLTVVMGLGVALSAACVGGAPDVPEPDAEFSAESFTMRFGPMSDENRGEALRLLDLQVKYLIEQMDEIRSGQLEPHARARYDLLESMYVERLEQYETLKMEAEVNRRLETS